MTIIVFTVILACVAYFVGILGALTGLGGGVVLIPVLVLLFHINIHYAMGTSLISVIATSSGAGMAYLREGYANIRIGMFLEIGAVLGALAGAIFVTMISPQLIAIIFGIVLLISAYLSWRRKEEVNHDKPSHPWALFLKLNDKYPRFEGKIYHVQNVPTALCIMFIAGILSALLGIGSGALKVLAMDQAMGLPYKVSTATSNFIIGITAAVSASVYFTNGFIDPVLTFPVMLGVLAGAFTGAEILKHMHPRRLRILFSFVIAMLAFEMIYKGMTGHL